MAFVHGKNAYFQLDNASNTLVDLSAYCDSFNVPEELSADETTTFGTTGAKTYIPGLNDAKISIEGKYDATLDAHMTAVLAAQQAATVLSSSFVLGPAGSATGKPKRTGEAVLTSYEVTPKVSDVITWKAELQVTGGITKTTF